MAHWWRSAVVYQIYPRSFADGNGDGTGDLRGITDRMDYIAGLGVDALWLGPFFKSPQVDHGYDVSDYRDVDPLFGTLQDFDDLIAAAHERGIRVTVDFVPNHTSDQHAWFQAALAAGPGSPERTRFHFRDGAADGGPPNNWTSVFGGPSWTQVPDGQWYYHLFAKEQPDLNWENPEVLAEFLDVLKFWLDRGVDGFRIDVSDALIKDATFPDTETGEPVIPKDDASGVHEIYRAFRRLFDSYDRDPMAVIETGATDDIVALFLRPDEMQLAFNFRFLRAGWQADKLRDAIDASLAANAAVGAPSTWVIDNHDSPRSVTRLGALMELQGDYVPGTMNSGPDGEVDLELGLRRSRAMALLVLALPGSAYLYNGQELGLENIDDLPENVLQDPIWERSGRTNRGRDGCRIPMPWSGEAPPFGFTADGVAPWLPIPAQWRDRTVERQEADRDSLLHLYHDAIAARRLLPGDGLTWTGDDADVLQFRRGDVVVCVNLGAEAFLLPAGEVLLSSEPVVDGALPSEAAAWVRE
jgi:alpha-glucosidase